MLGPQGPLKLVDRELSLPLDKLLPWGINVLNLLLIPNGDHSSDGRSALRLAVVSERYHSPLRGLKLLSAQRAEVKKQQLYQE